MLPYNLFYAPRLLPEGVTIEDKYPAISAWQERLCERASVFDSIKEREVLIRQFGFDAPAFKDEKAHMEPVFTVLPVLSEVLGVV